MHKKSLFSINKRAKKIVWNRKVNWIPIDQPCELWYTCPVCKNKNIVDWKFDERLAWSEYEWFLWCRVCNKDYPSCLCCWDDIDKATNIYLDCIEYNKWNTI